MITFCKRCVMPDTKPDLFFNEQGVCDACVSAEDKNKVDWSSRRREFWDLCSWAKSQKRQYDCVIPVSGGKDSHYQTYKALEYGLKPLCVTFQPTLQTELGKANLNNLISLGIDHITVTPNPRVYKAMGLEAFRRIGDHEWPNHLGIFTTPIQVAVEKDIPLIIWGENSQLEYGGPEQARKKQTLDRRWLEEFGGLLGNRPTDMLGVEGITEEDLVPYTYPSEKDMKGIRSVFLGYFFKWDARAQVEIIKQVGFQTHDGPVEGTYTDYENLDDAIVSIHDYFKYLKFGFGRATDHACIDIRNGRLTRPQAIELVKQYDGQISSATVGLFCAHYDLSPDEFSQVVYKFMNRKLFEVTEGLPTPKWSVS